MIPWIIASFATALLGLFVVLIVIPIFLDKKVKDSWHLYLIEMFALACTLAISMCILICGNSYHTSQILARHRQQCQMRN